MNRINQLFEKKTENILSIYFTAGLTIKFLNPQTRKDSYTNAYLLKIIPN